MSKDLKKYLGIGLGIIGIFLFTYYWAVIAEFLFLLLGALSPLIGGVIIAYIVNIPLDFIEKALFGRFKNGFVKAIKRPISILLAFLFLSAIIFLVVTLILPELTECINLIVKETPKAIDGFVKFYQDMDRQYEISKIVQINVEDLASWDWEGIISSGYKSFTTGITSVVDSVVAVVSAVFSTIISVFMSFVFSIYLLVGKERILGGIKRVMLAYMKPKIKDHADRILHVMNLCFHRFIVGQFAEAIILGVLCSVGMMIFGFPYATMIGTLMGFLALVPIVGAYLGAVVGAVMVWTAGDFIQALLFVVFIVVLQQLEGNLIYPKVVGASLGLPGIWVLATVTVMGTIGGIPAMFFGVPLVAACYKLLKGDVKNRLCCPYIPKNEVEAEVKPEEEVLVSGIGNEHNQ